MAPPQWAYQVENFVNEPDEELVCSICRAVFCDPVMCPCDHVFCLACITKWLLNSKNCPICRKRVSNSSVKQMVPIIKNLIMKLMLNCHNKTLGCKAQFSLESSEGHMKECEYELVQCKNKPCKDRLFRKDIREHETSDCLHRYTKCKTCGSKMPTSEPPENHDCIQDLLLTLKRKRIMIQKRNKRIEELTKENEALKAASQGTVAPLTSSRTRGFGHPLTSSTLSSLSPEEIMINIAELESMSSSLTSDSDDSSENSIIIFTNSPLDHSDDNAESESFSAYMDNQDSVEYSRNESSHNTSEYRNAESQTMDDLSLNEQQNDLHCSRSGNSASENDGIAIEIPNLVFDETEERTQSRPVKRRPTTQKPAKRRLPPLSPSSSDDNESKHSSLRLSKRCWRLSSTETDRGAGESSQGDSSLLKAGPSSVSVPVAESSIAHDMSSNTKWRFRSKSKLDQKRRQQMQIANCTGNNAVMNSKIAIPSGNAVFERTLALLEQYNLESDPEWLPEYASHRGNDTTDSESSFEAEFLDESSNSELSDSDSNNEDNSNVIRGDSECDSAAISDFVNFMHCNFNSTSEDDDDPDWDPVKFLQNKHA